MRIQKGRRGGRTSTKRAQEEEESTRRERSVERFHAFWGEYKETANGKETKDPKRWPTVLVVWVSGTEGTRKEGVMQIVHILHMYCTSGVTK